VTYISAMRESSQRLLSDHRRLRSVGMSAFALCASVQASTAEWGLFCGGAVIGDPRAARFVREAVAGVDSIDFLFVGDSNTGFGGYGWLDGIVYGCTQFGVPYYGSPIYPMLSVGTDIGFAVAHSGGELSVIDPDGNGDVPPLVMFPNCSNGGGCVQGGREFGPTALTDRCSVDADASTGLRGFLAPTGIQLDYGWVDHRQAPYANYGGGVYLGCSPSQVRFESDGLLMADALVYRVVYGSGGGGAFTMRIRGAEGVSFGDRRIEATSREGWHWSTADLAIPADPDRRTSCLHCGWGGAGVGPSAGVDGPIGLGWHSVFRRGALGVSATPLVYRGGAALSDIASDLQAVSDGTIGQYLRMLRQRQTDNGGSGRIVVFVQGGVNLDPVPRLELPGTWATSVLAITARISAAWAFENFPLDDIAFIAMVSHQTDPKDELLGRIREASVELGRSRSVDGLCVVNLRDLANWDEYAANAWHNNSSSEPGFDDFFHLKQAGYAELGHRIVSALLDFAVCPGDLDGDGAIDGSELGEFLSGWASGSQSADLNCDGSLSGADIGILLGQWGTCAE
jgi:hypothetical protein